MKFKSIVLFLLLGLTLVNCKNEANSSGTENKQAEAPKKVFTVALDVVVKKDDDFCVLYTEDGSTDFKEGIWKAVKGSDTQQTIEFALPEDVVPTQIRLDFGISKEQETIMVNGFSMNYLGKTFKAPGEQFYLYFAPDVSKTIFDKDKRTIDAVVKDGVRQYPSFYPNTKPVGEEIAKLVQ
jgi:hypothetical protein